MTLQVYLDESGHSADPNVRAFTLAGLRGADDQWTSFETRWAAMLKAHPRQPTELHMRHLYSRSRSSPYHGWSQSDRDLLAVSATKVITDSGMTIVGSRRHLPDDMAQRESIELDYFQAYQAAIHASVQGVPPDEKVHFIFAIHEEIGQEALKETHARILKAYHEYFRDQRPDTIDFARPRDVLALQAADLVAWELSREARAARDGTEIRPTLRELHKLRVIVYNS